MMRERERERQIEGETDDERRQMMRERDSVRQADSQAGSQTHTQVDTFQTDSWSERKTAGEMVRQKVNRQTDIGCTCGYLQNIR